jgi:signal transduction histidine kinase
VWVDASQLEQALMEVLGNALEAMPNGGLLTLAAHAAAPGESVAVQLTIQDTGVGIPAPVLSRVVEPFFTTRADGTGLGLAIAKRFVEQNQGRFEISSVERGGTTVTISLPAAAPAAAATS